MTHEELREVVAEQIRNALERHMIVTGQTRGLQPWSELPDSRKTKYREMAQAAIEVMRS